MTYVVKVAGMSCAHCAASIEKAFGTLDVKAQVDLDKHTVTIEDPKSKMTLAIIKDTIEDLGYDVNE